MAMFNTQAPTYNSGGASQLIKQASESPLKGMSKVMGELSGYLDDRVKDRYTKEAIESMSGAKSLADIQSLGIDMSKLSDSGKQQYSSSLDMLNRLGQEEARKQSMELQRNQEERASTTFGNQQDEILKNQITNEVLANLDSMTPEQIQQAKQYSGLDSLVLDKYLADKKTTALQQQKLKSDIAKANYRAPINPTEVSVYVDYFNRMKANGTLPEGVMTPMGLKQHTENKYKTKDITSKAGAVAKVAGYEKRKANGEALTAVEEAEYITYKNYVDSEGDEKRNIIISKSDILNKYTADDADLSNIDIKDINKLQSIEDQTEGDKTSATFKKDIRDREQTISSGERLIERLDKIKPEKINRGIIDTVKQQATQLVSDDRFQNMSVADKEKALLTIGVNTAVGSALATYIKSISGTAVAEAEYNRLMKVFSTGNYSNIQSLKQAIKTFYDDAKYNHQAYLKNNIRSGGSFVLDKLYLHNKKYGSKTNSNYKIGDESENGVVTASDGQFYKTEDGKVHKY